jgi:hypothetical protein
MQRAFKRVQIRVNQVTINKAVKKDRGNIRAILKGHSDTNAIKKELNHYFRTTSPQIWRSALKQVWLDAGAASIELHHAFFTGSTEKSYIDELDAEPEDEWAPLPAFDFFVKAADPTDSWANSVDDYLRGNGAGRADGISSTTGDQVMNSIADGVAAKEGTADIAARVEDQLDTTWPGRAETIARTETAAATNQASLEDAQATVPGLNKTWLCSFVNSREAHMDADGQSVAQDDPFDVDGEDLDYPADPSGSPENVINCMCSIGYEPPEDATAAEEGEAPELTDEQTSQLADLYDQLASGEGELSSEEAQAMVGGVEDIVGPAEGGEAAAGGGVEFPAGGFDSVQAANDYLTQNDIISAGGIPESYEPSVASDITKGLNNIYSDDRFSDIKPLEDIKETKGLESWGYAAQMQRGTKIETEVEMADGRTAIQNSYTSFLNLPTHSGTAEEWTGYSEWSKETIADTGAPRLVLGWLPDDQAAEAAAEHEMGHAAFFGFAQPGNSASFSREFVYNQSVWTNAWTANKEALAGLSEYAAKDPAEGFSEVFEAYQHPELWDKIPGPLLDIVKGWYS